MAVSVCWMTSHSTFVSVQEIEKFRDISREIMALPSFHHYDMIHLDCDDLKRGLANAARGLADILLERVVTDHRNENRRWEVCVWEVCV